MTDAAGRPLVSVVVNNHNYAPYLPAAIESALAQTWRPLEVVVVDDGSSDDSARIIRGFGDRVRSVLKENGGQASALNTGFAASRGDLVMFLDADDVLEPGAAAAMVAAWGPGVAKVQASVRLLDRDGRPAGGSLPAGRIPSGDLRDMVLRSGSYPATGTTGTAFDRRCLERLLPIPEEEWRRAPDVYLLLLAPFVGSIASVETPAAGVRVHGENAWSMDRVTPDRLLEYLAMDLRKEALLRDRAGDLGTAPPSDWLLRNPGHVQCRLSLLRLDPARHPFPGDRRLGLAWRGVRAALGHRGFHRRKRLLFAVWSLLVATLPRGAAERLVRAGIERTTRPSWLQGFIERGGR